MAIGRMDGNKKMSIWEQAKVLFDKRDKLFLFYIALIAITSFILVVSVLIQQVVVTTFSAFLLGIGMSLVANEIHTFSQYQRSTAFYRLNEVIKATQELLRTGAQTGQLRSRYRYSLGVIIDHLRGHLIKKETINTCTVNWLI